MKIAIFHELGFGGARRAAVEIARELKKENIVDLYFTDSKNLASSEEKNAFSNFFYYEFTPKKWNGKNWKTKLYKESLELIILNNLHKKIARDINGKRYDLIFVHPSKLTQAPFILKFLNAPIVYYCPEPLRIVYDPFLKLTDLAFSKKITEEIFRTTRKFIDKKNINQSRMILTNSNFTKEWIRNSYKKDSIVSYLGVDTNIFKPLNIKKEYDILFFGEKSDIEGYPLLKQAISFFNKTPKIKVLERNENFSDKDLVREYNKAKILVALSKNEPFGLIPLEGMACGIPVVAVNEGGYKETVVNGKTGYLIDRDPKVLFEKLNYFLQNEKIRKEFGANATRYIAKNWTWKNNVNKLSQTLNLFINEN
ncbi:glycosyltransferase family 4 protein [Patescibacteria group bacterium]|nr:glycosyltransferase family 4 protein [Patescibacteria group bacterium]